MRKLLLAGFAFISALSSFAQKSTPWRVQTAAGGILLDKGAARPSFPKEFKLFFLDQPSLRAQLFRVVNNAAAHTTVITLPTAAGGFEEFEIVEASNMEPALQNRYPEIRAFSGRGVTDRYATLKLSYSPQGVQGMVFRADAPSEFIEPYSQDHTIYAAFRRDHGRDAADWKCGTPDVELTNDLNRQVFRTLSTARSGGNLKTMRLAQSVTAEYSNYFGATSAAQSGLVLAAVNATLTRCNGVYEKDLAVHLNLVSNTTNVFYYDPNSDPYDPGATGAGGSWNNQLQATLTSEIGEANYDIGHLFGASGGGGNAGCIGCICVNNQKGKGFTSPGNGIPQGDDFDIDYVVHEIGHQMGANHTFSHSLEGSGQNKEVGSGITIMGYAGITSRDVVNHSIDIYHATSIGQIQTNLLSKTCPVTTTIVNAAPVVAPVQAYTIPISTPFALTGSATDADNDPITYCWEQNDNAPSGQSGANSKAYATKPTGPNYITFQASATPTRVFPRLSSILNGALLTGPLTGGDAGMDCEALSSVARTLNFRLTVRDNAPYSSTAPVKVGQTQFTDVAVTVTASSGPFAVTAPNTAAVSWASGTTQTVTWNVNNTTAAPVSCANVRILLSVDGGFTWPYELLASTANDGSETITVPTVATTTARIKVESVGNIFFDISNANFTITNNACAATVTTQPTAASTCPNATATFSVAAGGSSLTYQWQVSTDGGANYSNVSGATAATYSFTATAGQNGYLYRCVVLGGCGGPATSNAAPLSITAATSVTGQPTNQVACSGATATFNVAATGGSLSYQWQVSTDGGSTYNNVSGATAATYSFTPAAAQNGNSYRCVISSACSAPVTSGAATLTVNAATTLSSNPTDATLCAGGNASFTVAASGNALTYQWQVSTDGGTTYNNVSNTGIYGGATSATLSITGVTNAVSNYRYRCVVGSNCPNLNSTAALLTVNTAPAVTTEAQNATVCGGQTASFTLAASGTAPVYQWQLSTDGGTTFSNLSNGSGYAGVGTASLSITPASPSQDGYRYRCLVSGTCSPAATSAVRTLQVFTPIALTTQPSNVAVCAGTSTTLSVAATGSQPSYQWQLSTNGGAFTDITGATGATLALNNLSTTANGNQYRCVVSGAAPCGPVTSATASLTVNPLPQVSLQAAPYTSIYPGQTTTLTAGATPSSVTYQWFYNAAPLAGVTGTNYVVNIDKIGTYSVKATDGIGCFGNSTDVVIEAAASASLFIYPNPNSGQFQVRFFNAGAHQSPRTLKVYDAKGAVVYSALYLVTGLYDRMDVSIPNAAKGIYIVGLFDASGARIAQGKVMVR